MGQCGTSKSLAKDAQVKPGATPVKRGGTPRLGDAEESKDAPEASAPADPAFTPPPPLDEAPALPAPGKPRPGSAATEEAPSSARRHDDEVPSAIAGRSGSGRSQESASGIIVESLEATGEWDAPSKPAAAGDESDDDDSDDDDDDALCGRGRAEPDPAPAGSAMMKLGIGGAAQRSKCPPLHCTSCNFAVVRFSGHRWHRRADYMHFRNFAGHSYDLAKLRTKLAPDAAFAAYCCQCTWQSVDEWKPLDQWGTDPGGDGGAANGEVRWKKAAPTKAAGFGR